VLADVTKRSACHSFSEAPLPSLQPLLGNEQLAHVLHSYLGGKVRYDGHMTQRINATLVSLHYSAVVWHHDLCGRRLKLFIFLSDVSAEHHPMQIATGTHNTLYYSMGLPRGGRYSESYVKTHHKVVNMTGRRGAGFIFDTNALHRGVAVGALTREVVILEFHPHGKVPLISRHGPCPSRKDRATSHRSVRYGMPGFPLYPNEPPIAHGDAAEQLLRVNPLEYKRSLRMNGR